MGLVMLFFKIICIGLFVFVSLVAKGILDYHMGWHNGGGAIPISAFNCFLFYISYRIFKSKAFGDTKQKDSIHNDNGLSNIKSNNLVDSKNIDTCKIENIISLEPKNIKQIIACPYCSQRLSVPDNKELIVTCPSCSNTFEINIDGKIVKKLNNIVE